MGAIVLTFNYPNYLGTDAMNETQTRFTFNQLSDKSKEKARETVRQWTYEDDFACEVENLETAIESIGFTNADIRFSGFHSQGDGASFTSDVDIVTLVKFLLDESDNCDVQWLKIDKPSFNQHFLSWFLS